MNKKMVVDGNEPLRKKHDSPPLKHKKRAWRAPEIVNVGGVLDLTEAVAENLADGWSPSMIVSYKKGYG
jgi:hypothetical protein